MLRNRPKTGRRKVMLFTLLLVLSFVSLSETNECRGKTCASCIKSGGSCAWCKASNFSLDDAYGRCDTYKKLKAANCSDIVSPNNTVNLIRNKKIGGEGNDSTQLQPQVVNITLRPNKKETVYLRFRTARNYPVDLYFLFDLSRTMKEHKEKLGNLADTLAKTIGSISHNYQLGFGYFQDKVIMPFTSTLPALLKNPCATQKSHNATQTCAPPFGYRHSLQLTTDLNEFVKAIEKSRVTGNIDVPEGGLDAIMQAVMCEKIVGWREVGRRLLIYASDEIFHIAGDGRLAGIVKPNDCKCHVNESGINTEELNQDYPSVGQIVEMVGTKNVLMIFAITQKSRPYVKETYQLLKERIRGSSLVSLNNDSSNIVDLIKKEYEKIISQVEMNVNASKGINVVLRSNCSDYQGKKERNKCDRLNLLGSGVVFDVELTATVCPEVESERHKTVTIQPVGLSEKLVINIDLICECECEKPGQEVKNSEKCSYNGTYECGICSCNKDHYGSSCECSRYDIKSGEKKKACIRFTNHSIECSSHGECVCGKCECVKPYSGKYCECNNEGCPRFGGAICGGPLRGQCVCGKCSCSEDYTGDDCSCSLSTDTCIGQDNKICSGRGNCTCGKCDCTEGYVGNCQTCPTCPSVCSEFRPCAECLIGEDGDDKIEKCADKCGNVGVAFVDEFKDDANENVCEGKDLKACIIKFRLVHFGPGNTTMQILNKKECPKEIALLPIIAGVIGGIVAVGLLLLIIWKLLTSVLDGIEYARFIEESKKEKWAKQINPIYKGPTTTFRNPIMEERMRLNDD